MTNRHLPPFQHVAADSQRFFDSLLSQNMDGVNGVALNVRGLHTADKVFPNDPAPFEMSLEFRWPEGELVVLVGCRVYPATPDPSNILGFRNRVEETGAHKGILITQADLWASAIEAAEIPKISIMVARGFDRFPNLVRWQPMSPAQSCGAQIELLRSYLGAMSGPRANRISHTDSHLVRVAHGGAELLLHPRELRGATPNDNKIPTTDFGGTRVLDGRPFQNVPPDRLAKLLLVQALVTAG